MSEETGRYELERFAHVGGAQLPGVIHLWGYTADLEEDWSADDYFRGSGMRAGDWLLVTMKDDDRCWGVLCVIATVNPIGISRVSCYG